MNYSYDHLSSTIFNVFLNSSRQGERVNLGVWYLDDTLSISVYGFPDDVPDEAPEDSDDDPAPGVEREGPGPGRGLLAGLGSPSDIVTCRV